MLTLAACDGGHGDVSSSLPADDSSAPVSPEEVTSSTSESATTTTTDEEDSSTTTAGLTTTGSRTRTTTTTETITTTTTENAYISTVGEKPYTGNAAILYNKQSSRFDAQSEKKRQEILNLKDTVKATGSGTTYYISPKGDDENAGTSKDKAWRTTKNLDDHTAFKAGDAVLFERGGVYRNVSFHVASGVSYGAYGTGIQSGHNTVNKNITIRGCEIGWIGGSLLDRGVRYGNGIEFNGWIDDALVEDNWVYQCYDTNYTNQGSNCYQKNITVKENLMEYSPYNIEVWTAKEIGKGGMTNCTFKDNILRFAGYGWGTLNRVGSNSSVIGNISFYDYVIPCENVLISGNIFDCSYRYLVSIAYPNDTEGRGPTITGNTWNQKPFKNHETTACVNRLLFDGKEILNCSTQAEMEASVAKVDKAPKAVTLEK